MNPIELDEKLVGTVLSLIVGTILSWKIFEVVTKNLEKGNIKRAIWTVFAVCVIFSTVAGTFAAWLMAYRHFFPKAAATPQPAEVRPEPTPPARAEHKPPQSERAFRPRVNTRPRPSQSSAPATSQQSNAPATAETSQAPDVAPPVSGQPSRSTSPETRPQFLAQPPAPGCNPTPPPATIITPRAKRARSRTNWFSAGA